MSQKFFGLPSLSHHWFGLFAALLISLALMFNGWL